MEKRILHSVDLRKRVEAAMTKLFINEAGEHAQRLVLTRDQPLKAELGSVGPRVVEKLLLDTFAGLDLNEEPEEMTAMRIALTKAAEKFHEYAELHLKKGTPEGEEKAMANLDMAYLCEGALAPPKVT